MVELSVFHKLCERLNTYTRHALEVAVHLCRERGHYDVTVDHFLFKLLDDPNCDIGLIARACDIDPGQWQAEIRQRVDALRTGASGEVHWTEDVLLVTERAWRLSSVDLGYPEIRSASILLAISQLRAELAISFGTGLDESALNERMLAFTQGDFESQLSRMIEGSIEGRPAPSAPQPSAGVQAGGALDRFAISLNELAREGRVDRVVGRDMEIRQVVDILARRRKNNAILVGEPGVGKTAIAEGLALRIVEGLVPSALADVEIRSLDLGLLQAGAGVKGEFENRLKKIIGEVTGSKTPIVLFIDEAHLLIGAGNQPGSGDAANLLKPALARGQLRTIAATTWAEYKKHIEKDPALQDRFEVVRIAAPDEELAATMLRGTKQKYEEHHDVQILDEGLVAAVRLSNRYLVGRHLPRKAVDLLDTAAARVHVGLTGKPPLIEDLEARIENLNIEREAKRRDQRSHVADHASRLTELDDLIQSAESELEQARTRWEAEKAAVEHYRGLCQPAEGENSGDDRAEEAKAALEELRAVQGHSPLVPVHMDERVAAQVIADWTGIPVGQMVEEETPRLLQLDAQLRERVRGQDHALARIVETIRISKAGLGNPQAPMGVFLLVGPAGTGKTETALALADSLFGGERFIASLNMSEYKEEHTVSLLIGAPPGYVGYGEGGVLTEAIRQRPYSVLLLDEVEKAHPKVLEIFYQIFEKGSCEDRTGRLISFRNTIVLMTSNLDSGTIVEMCGAAPRPEPEEIVDAIRPTLIEHFKAALLSRFRVIPYYPLSHTVLREIVVLKLDRIGQRFYTVHGIEMGYSEELVDHISARCEVTELGARQIDHHISERILPQLSLELLKRLGDRDMPDTVHLALSDSGECTYSFDGGAATS